MATSNQSDVRAPEPLDEAIARWGRLASPRLLRILGAVAVTGTGIVLAVDWRRWPVASLLAALGCFAGWGLLAHQPQERAGLPLRLAQTALAAVGAVTAGVGLLGLLFWALGPAPIL
jgi:hypothetical protein